MEGIIHSLDGAEDQIHLAVVHLKPGFVAVVVIIRLEAFDQFKEIVPYALLDCNIGSPLKVALNLADIFSKSVVVPDGLEATVGRTAYDRIRIVLLRIVPSEEFRRGHVRGIETCSVGFAAKTGKERLTVDAVPRAVVDSGVKLFGRIRKRSEEGFPVTEILLPVDLVHLVCSHTVQSQDFFSVVGDARKVRGRNGHLGIILHEPANVCPVLRTRHCDHGQE